MTWQSHYCYNTEHPSRREEGGNDPIFVAIHMSSAENVHVARVSRDSNPGWGDWRRSLCGWVCFVVCFVFSGNYESMIFACHATGLDAVQRLEQKKGSNILKTSVNCGLG